MNELQNLYEKINPADDPETVAKRIIARSEEKKNSTKTCRPRRFAAAACIAAALIAAVPVTTSAMKGSNIFEVFQSYFHTQELSPVSIVEYHETIEVNGGAAEADGGTTEADNMIIESDEYTVTVNGFAADRHTLFVFFDIEYKNPLYFENGQLRQEFLEWKPVIFWAEPQTSFMHGGGGAGGGRVVSVDGARVSYVTSASWSNSFFVAYKNEYCVKIGCTLYGLDSDGNINPVPMEYDGVIYAHIPATKDITLTVNDEVTRPNGIESVLNRIELNSLSVYFYLTTDAECSSDETLGTKIDLSAPKLIFKDGTVLDLAEGFDYEHRISGSGGHQTGNGPVTEYYYYVYDTVIDPESIEAVELFGNIYTVE